MVKMDKRTLNKAVKGFVKDGNIETAKNFIIIFGTRIEDYDIQTELKKLESKKK